MITIPDTRFVKAQMAAYLISFRLEDRHDDIPLDIIEFIALRMTRREDIDVFELGVFVRANLACFDVGTLTYPDILTRFTAAALAAPLGPAQLIETFHIGTRGCHL